MQGRLTPSNGNKIQFFPWKNWTNEFSLASNKVDLIEWTIDEFDIHKNPIFKNNNLIRELSEINNVKVKRSEALDSQIDWRNTKNNSYDSLR